MYSSASAQDGRPRREKRLPVWMEEYIVPPPMQQRLPHPPQDALPKSAPQWTHFSLERPEERFVRMAPLSPPHSTEELGAVGGARVRYQRQHEYDDIPLHSTPAPPPHRQAAEATTEVIDALYTLMQDNRRMQQQMAEMQRRLDASARFQEPPGLQRMTLPPHSLLRHTGIEDSVNMPPTPPPAQAIGHPMPLADEEDWPPPPPETLLPPLPAAQDRVAELTSQLRDLRASQDQPVIPPPLMQPPQPAQPQRHSLPYYTPARSESLLSQPQPTNSRERVYRGPKPTIPAFTRGDPREFARMKVALENLLPEDATERFKYQILVDHLQYEEALLVADSYVNSLQPYSDTMAILTEQYGQPHQLALRKIAELMEAASVTRGDSQAFRRFALRVRALVGLLDQLGENGRTELNCGSHVTRLLSKLPQDMRAEFKRFLYPARVTVPTLLNFSEWLNYELRIQESLFTSQNAEERNTVTKPDRRRDGKRGRTTILNTAGEIEGKATVTKQTISAKPTAKTAYCPYCMNNQHFLDQCANFSQLTVEQKSSWIKSSRGCWRCARSHQAAQCRLKVVCQKCSGKHLQALHEVNAKPVSDNTSCLINMTNDVLYMDRRGGNNPVLLKVCKVLLRNGAQSLETYAILDDGSERTILLSPATQQLKLAGEPEDLIIRTVRQDLRVIHGSAVSFTISPADQPLKSFQIQRAFTADQLSLAEHSYPVRALQKKHRHLRNLPLQPFSNVQPLILIGSDYPQLVTPTESVRLGRPGGPAAVKTRLGWTLQGPIQSTRQHRDMQQCLHISTVSPTAELLQNVERLWQLDTLPYKSEKLVSRSRQDQEAVHLLESKTVRVDIDGIQRYATPLLRVKNMPQLKAPKDAVMSLLCSTERRLLQDPSRAAAYCTEINKLESAGYAVKVSEDKLQDTRESWYIPHHMVSHNNKNRIVFNCSFRYRGDNLNELLLPGPTLTSSLLGVLLRFREHAVAVSSDIKGMFHQVRLLPEDRPLLRFLWRNMETDKPPNTYVWQVLPFGTTCSPCCATFALQKHVLDHSSPEEDVRESIERSFYVDNCLQSFPSADKARHLVDKLTALLATGGFELRQWASNMPTVISHLPKEARSTNSELWLNESSTEPQELTLGLLWRCDTDTLSYKYQMHQVTTPTMRTIYKNLARLYDPLGFLVPFTTRAKILVQQLWDKQREWDDPSLPVDLLESWKVWERELQQLGHISLPRCYVSPAMDTARCPRDLHIFADASERAYGSVAYLRTEGPHGQVEMAFLTARSRVAPKRQLSVPRLELCAALTAAQLAALLRKELSVTCRRIYLWTDSTTVLTWLQSESCRYRVFVGTRVAEIQELTDAQCWRYVDSANNPADDLTRGKTLLELSQHSRWRQGPAFLQDPPTLWPAQPTLERKEETAELRKVTVSCLTTTLQTSLLPDTDRYATLTEFVRAVALARQGAAGCQAEPSAADYKEAEREILRQAQRESFAEEVELLSAGKPIATSSKLLKLDPEYDEDTGLIRVGGRLRLCELEPDAIHPVVLDPHHKVTQLIIKDMDVMLHHPGAERLLAELRRRFWILRGREAVKRHQHLCQDCQRWRATPNVPKMADLPPTRLRLHKPPFYSTGMDCFGPFIVKVGRRQEKRWGIVFKCLTTRAVHLDLLPSLDSDSFLMALRRFIARRGKPAELLSDQGTNFKGGASELQEAFKDMTATLRDQLASHQITFSFNPPSAPHFGGAWEREVRSIKAALRTVIQSQSVPEEVLQTVLIEVEGILNSKPLGYVSTDVADADPITPNLLLMGRRDPSLPQVIYTEAELLGRRRWRHTQVLAEQFWRHFIRSYLPTLQTRTKWHRDPEQLRHGTIVMVVDPQLPRSTWPVGEVTTVIPGKDGRVRTAVVKVHDRTYTRPVARLISLPSLPP